MIRTDKKRTELGTTINDLPAVTVAATSTLILAHNMSRKTATILAAAANTEPIWLRFQTDGTAVASTGLALDPGAIYEVTPEDWYGGGIYGICASGGMIVYLRETV